MPTGRADPAAPQGSDAAPCAVFYVAGSRALPSIRLPLLRV